MRTSNERGIAMITTLLVLMLISALLVGFTTMVMSDQRYRFIDRDRGAAFYAASGAIEKLTADLGNNFFKNVAPTAGQITTMAAALPTITGITFTTQTAPETLPGSSLNAYSCSGVNHIVTKGPLVGTVVQLGYNLTFCADAAGNPTSILPAANIKTGPYEGLIALQTPYQIDVTAKTTMGGEVHLARTIETVAIPVFQFGMFSDVDLSFSAAEDFTFGGRVHTNSNLFLAEGAGNTLTLSGKVTAVKEVVRKFLSNEVPIATVSQTGTVNIASSSTAFVALAQDKGSVVDGPLSAKNGTWHNTSLSTYNSWLRNGLTGAKPLNLALVMPGVGGKREDLVKRPVWTPALESTTSILYNERLFSKASIRILLSDLAADINNLPGIGTGTAVQLDGDWTGAGKPAGYNGAATVDTAHPPIALSPGPLATTLAAGSTANTIKVASTVPFRPTMTLTSGATQTVMCTAKDAANKRFTGCTTTATAAANSTLAAGNGISALVAATTPIGTNVTLTLASSALAAPFIPIPFWINDTLFTCTSWDATPQFTGCAGQKADGTAAVPPTTAGAIVTSASYSNPGISTIGGWIKIERQNLSDSSWNDVTMEILNYGIGDINDGGTICAANPNPNAIIRLQRLRDNGGGTPTTNGGGCNYATDTSGAKDPKNWWPMALFDTREGVNRDSNYPGATNLPLGGLIYYVGLDAGNLAKWFQGTVAPYACGVACTGHLSKTDTAGYTVYFSDRRNNRCDAASTLTCATDQETGEYGWEDFVNDGVANYAPNGGLPEAGEDVNGNGRLDVYGGVPNYNGVHSTVPPCASCDAVYGVGVNPLKATVKPTNTITRSTAQVNRPILFRRALKLMNGAVIAPTISGLTIVSENPVYLKGDWNVNAGNFNTGVHAATSIIADAVTLLSNTWVDGTSMDFPYVASSRPRPSDNYYRVAIMSGKSMIFKKPGDVVTASTFGTDGGAHSFLRMLEGGAGDTVHYRGSMATFFYSRQAVGTFKCCGSSVTGVSVAGGIVYGIPTRDFVFDADFLEPTKLPPNTPVFRDMNAVGFSQELRPGR